MMHSNYLKPTVTRVKDCRHLSITKQFQYTLSADRNLITIIIMLIAYIAPFHFFMLKALPYYDPSILP